MFYRNNLPHELLLTTRQKTKVRNAFENKMSTDIKLPKIQISNNSEKITSNKKQLSLEEF